ncbi:unnamed protein product [Brassica oleracea var. botrytis]
MKHFLSLQVESTRRPSLPELPLRKRVDMDHPHLPIYKLKAASSRFVSPKLQNKISAEEQLEG